jgi:hypothetical protein
MTTIRLSGRVSERMPKGTAFVPLDGSTRRISINLSTTHPNHIFIEPEAGIPNRQRIRELVTRPTLKPDLLSLLTIAQLLLRQALLNLANEESQRKPPPPPCSTDNCGLELVYILLCCKR